MKKTVLGIVMAAGVLLLAFIGFVAWNLTPKLRNMKSEYGTAEAIRVTEKFVNEHPGQWPRSWADIGLENRDALTKFNFSLDPNTATKEDVLASIQPLSGKYYTFPHSKEMLENLYSELEDGLRKPDAKADTFRIATALRNVYEAPINSLGFRRSIIFACIIDLRSRLYGANDFLDPQLSEYDINIPVVRNILAELKDTRFYGDKFPNDNVLGDYEQLVGKSDLAGAEKFLEKYVSKALLKSVNNGNAKP